MKILDVFKSKRIKTLEKKVANLETVNAESATFSGRSYPVRTEHFDGEKTPGEMGDFINAMPDYRGLRFRVYEATLKKDIVKIITGKFFKWVVGTGLKLQAKPNFDVLESEGINISKEDLLKFVRLAEARFSVYAGSIVSDYKRMNNLHWNASDSFATSFLSGDVLCILRIDEKNNLNVQVIDGQHISSPAFDTKTATEVKGRGNVLTHGVEKNARGEHVAFYVEVPNKEPGSIFPKHERVLARGETTGRLMAWLIYGEKHRIDHDRGIPRITQILEKTEKLDRYTEAIVGKAEEAAKIVLSIKHSRDSDGENPMLQSVRVASGLGHNAATETTGFELGEKTADRIGATTGKQTINLPIGAELQAVQTEFEAQYKEFSRAVFNYLCASMDIPPEVALQLYEQNYSSSRAAIMTWEFIVKYNRQKFSEKFYQPFYNLWLELEIIKNKIDAPGYIAALRADSFMAVEAYSKAMFTGPNMPHIDPLKEVNAVRKALGNDNIPLINHEQATEKINGNDWEKNIGQFKQEVDMFLTDFKTPGIQEEPEEEETEENNEIDE